MHAASPDPDCPLCPRLAAFRHSSAKRFPGWHNAPVPPFGPNDARLLIVGLAPGLRGANRTGRPFTGDYAGDLLYGTLGEFRFARGKYRATPDDGLTLADCRIVNAVRCVPPENRPTTREIRTCNRFLASEIANMPRLRAILALGLIAHKAVLLARGLVAARYPFGHGTTQELPDGLLLADSYHCSRYNTNTGRLTPEMFQDVFRRLRTILGDED